MGDEQGGPDGETDLSEELENEMIINFELEMKLDFMAHIMELERH